MALSDATGPARHRLAQDPGRRLSVGRRPPPAGDAPRAGDARSLWRAAASACPIPGRGSTTGAGRAGQSEARYEFLPTEGEGLHQIRRRADPCRHHRAGPFPLHRQWRDGGAARGAAGLRAQGRRRPARRRRHRARRADRRAHLGRQHGGLCLGLRPRRRGRARLDAAAARRAAARRHGRAGAAVRTTSATSARSATTPACSPSMPAAPCSARTCWPWPTPASAIA